MLHKCTKCNILWNCKLNSSKCRDIFEVDCRKCERDMHEFKLQIEAKKLIHEYNQKVGTI